MFLVGTDFFGSASFPIDRSRSEMITGERIDFTIDDVIRAEGPRVPAREMCHWKAAFIIVHEDGTPPTAQEIARVDTYRRRWEQFYADATDRRGSFDTTLAGTGLGTAECPSPANPNPAPDAGVMHSDAATPAPLADAGEADAGTSDPADAATTEARDAAAPQSMPNPQQDDGTKTILADDCACRHTGARGTPGLTLLFVALFALRRGRRGDRGREWCAHPRDRELGFRSGGKGA
jgi:hypothetical protein